MHQNNAQHGELTGGDFDDPRGQAMRDAMWKGHGGFEIALVPVFGAFVGWSLDNYLGIIPALTIVFAILGLVGAVANQYYRYKDSMEAATAERMARRRHVHTETSKTPAQPFGPVEREEPDMSVDFSTGGSQVTASEAAS